ncbi:MAG: ParB/RepB/Spo0J family partition protein [Candidatus Sumerlaeaceae bacterium]|nr:ParB/RepB/Spo0J family partition protein [Candidatus Sumerlaeaceae bacterium]
MQSKKRALGKGLGALLPPKPSAPTVVAVPVEAAGQAETFDGERLRRVPLELVKPNPNQPRGRFDEDSLKELAESIKHQGLIQPVAVAKRGDGFMIVAGERRWRAAGLAGIKTIPVIELTVTDQEVLEYALVENLQRENLNPMEEARAYKALMESFGLSQEEVADRVGKGRPTVANVLRLLKLPHSMQKDVEEGLLSPGHARALLSVENANDQIKLREGIVANGWSVREAERHALALQKRPAKSRPTEGKDPNVERLREQIVEALSCRVDVRAFGTNRGKIEIHYDSLDDLDRILAALGITG